MHPSRLTFPAGNSPRLSRLYENAIQNAGAGEREDNFAYGLNRMLDGIQAKL